MRPWRPGAHQSVQVSLKNGSFMDTKDVYPVFTLIMWIYYHETNKKVGVATDNNSVHRTMIMGIGLRRET